MDTEIRPGMLLHSHDWSSESDGEFLFITDSIELGANKLWHVMRYAYVNCIIEHYSQEYIESMIATGSWRIVEPGV